MFIEIKVANQTKSQLDYLLLKYNSLETNFDEKLNQIYVYTQGISILTRFLLDSIQFYSFICRAEIQTSQ